MTRMAPKPTDYARRASEPVASAAAPSIAVLRWRIGRSGSLVLSVGRFDDEVTDADACAASDTLRARIEIRRCPLAMSKAMSQPLSAPTSRALPVNDAGSEVLSGRVHATGDRLEHQLELSLCRGESMIGSTLSLVERPSAAPLVLTDLPIALGLRGGTYRLEEALLESFASTLRGLMHDAR